MGAGDGAVCGGAAAEQGDGTKHCQYGAGHSHDHIPPV